MMAARNGDAELVEFLLAQGADINARAADGSTALSLAAKDELPDMVKLLQEHGAQE
jgi:ankyrin repeat protein